MRRNDSPPRHETYVYTDPQTGELRRRRFRIEVFAGPSLGARCSIEGSCVVGGEGDCELLVDDPAVSRRHLELTARADGVRIRDLGSLNGTFLDGVRIHDVVLLPDPEVVLSIGRSLLKVGVTNELVPISNERSRFGEMVGESPEMRQLFGLAEQVAFSDAATLICGEPGTGKRHLAKALHQHSPRAEGPLVVLDCDSLEAGEASAALFGTETGKGGAFSRARGGTLLLESVEALLPATQKTLLKRLDEQAPQGEGPPFDVRLICTSTRNLAEEVRSGRFRGDLADRLGVVSLEIPPLRARTGDIPSLARHFARSQTGKSIELPAELVARLARHPWTGNGRELEGVIQQFLRGTPVELNPRPTKSKGSISGELAVVTALFCDLRGYTQLSESLRSDLPKLKRILNRYLARVTEVLIAHGGYIDKYVGDAVVCLFGAPMPQPNHASSACRAALEVQTSMEKLRGELHEDGLPELHARIGINSGAMMVGSIGQPEHGEYTAIGDEMNVASRLESANKTYGTGILIGPGTLELARADIEARELDWIRVAGRSEPLAIHQLLSLRGKLSEAERKARALYGEALGHYREGRFGQAASLLEDCLDLCADDKPAHRLHRLCRQWAKRPSKSFSPVTPLEK